MNDLKLEKVMVNKLTSMFTGNKNTSPEIRGQ